MSDLTSNRTDVQKIVVGVGSCGIAAGAREVMETIHEALGEAGIDIPITQTGCVGMCYREVLVDVVGLDGSRVAYGNVDTKIAKQIVASHVIEGNILQDHVVLLDGVNGPEAPFLAKQRRIVLRNVGYIDPEIIDDYVQRAGYEAVRKAVTTMTPEEIIATVKDSGLRGRGGAGFPTGMKWHFTRQTISDEKYIICNADEGDPGAFMDRSVLEGDPHSVLEGMLIAGYAIGAGHGYIYCRAEYPLAIQRLEIAIGQARDNGFLGESIFGSDYSFDIEIKQGAGAFVCGEETALMASIEGKRGMPRLRPPFPSTSGLWGRPTSINNVETFANVSWILLHGATEYAAIGTEKSKGNKVFALTGKVKRSGLAEVPMGMTLREVIFDVGGGMLGDKEFKAVQIGGPTGGCLPASLLDTPVEYDSLIAKGATIGSGGMVILDNSTCMVDLAKFFMSFAQHESCGKCVPCRVGTKRMLEILERITQGEGVAKDIDDLQALAVDVKSASLCGLGQTAPNPILTTLRYFIDEYKAHIFDHTCPAHACVDLIDVVVDQETCRQCAVCIRNCPVNAISGARKETTVIDASVCIGCRMCIAVCPFDAIDTTSPKQHLSNHGRVTTVPKGMV